MRISDEIRKEVWEEYGELEFILKDLKSIVQNPVELTLEDLNNHSRLTDSLIKKLGTLNRYICDKCIQSDEVKE